MRHGIRRLVPSCLAGLGVGALRRGHYTAALDLFAQAREAAAEGGRLSDALLVRSREAETYLEIGDPERALALALAVNDMARERGWPGAMAMAAGSLADALRDTGDPLGSLVVLEDRLGAAGGLPSQRAELEWRMARAHLALGDLDSASDTPRPPPPARRRWTWSRAATP